MWEKDYSKNRTLIGLKDIDIPRIRCAENGKNRTLIGLKGI